jgi:hypothetical protein
MASQVTLSWRLEWRIRRYPQQRGVVVQQKRLYVQYGGHWSGAKKVAVAVLEKGLQYLTSPYSNAGSFPGTRTVGSRVYFIHVVYFCCHRRL